MDKNATWYHAGRPRHWPHYARWGPSSPPKRSTAPNLRPMSVVAERHGWIKIPPGMEVGLGPGHIVLHGDPAPQKGAQPPSFRPTSIVAKR